MRVPSNVAASALAVPPVEAAVLAVGGAESATVAGAAGAAVLAAGCGDGDFDSLSRRSSNPKKK